jgi:hypothetical protein
MDLNLSGLGFAVFLVMLRDVSEPGLAAGPEKLPNRRAHWISLGGTKKSSAGLRRGTKRSRPFGGLNIVGRRDDAL